MPFVGKYGKMLTAYDKNKEDDKMKKLFVLLLLGIASVVSFAAEANLTVARKSPDAGCLTEYTPFKLTLAGPVALPPGSWNVKGVEIGAFNWTDRLQGLQFGVFNVTDAFSGLQLGIVNVSRDAYGLQIGVINVIESCDYPFFPIVNWNF